jgi:hypothetical protein
MIPEAFDSCEACAPSDGFVRVMRHLTGGGSVPKSTLPTPSSHKKIK